MIHASLFSGIGGPEIAAAMLGWENAFHCEINPFGRAILNYWFPNSISYEDITKTDFREWRGRIDVLTGGFPCQPFSYAGKRGGRNDERYLWPEMLRVIDEIRPTWVVGENVGGIATMVENGVCTELGRDTDLFGSDNDIYRYELRESYTLERIGKDLEAIRYEIQSFLIPAAAVGAPHRRDRIFIIAYNADAACGRGKPQKTRGRTESDGGDGISVAGERGRTTKQFDGLSTISRNATDAANKRRECGSYTRTKGKIFGTLENKRDNAVGNLSIKTIGNGRIITDADGAGRKEPVKSGREKDSKEIGTGLDCGIKRPCGNGFFADPGLLPGKRWERFPTVPPVHGRNDGFPFPVDNLTIPFAKWRTESLKAYGNAIVPQVMYEIFRAIELVNSEK